MNTQCKKGRNKKIHISLICDKIIKNICRESMFSFEKYKHLQEIPPQKVCEIPTLKFLECDPFFF